MCWSVRAPRIPCKLSFARAPSRSEIPPLANFILWHADFTYLSFVSNFIKNLRSLCQQCCIKPVVNTVERKCSPSQREGFVRLCQTQPQKLLPLVSLVLALQASSMPMYCFKMDSQTLRLSLGINPWAEHGRELVSIRVFTSTSKWPLPTFDSVVFELIHH